MFFTTSSSSYSSLKTICILGMCSHLSAMIICTIHGNCDDKVAQLTPNLVRTHFGRWGIFILGFCFFCDLIFRNLPWRVLLILYLFFNQGQEVAVYLKVYLVWHMVRIGNLMWIGTEGIVMTENILLDGLVHITTDSK